MRTKLAQWMIGSVLLAGGVLTLTGCANPIDQLVQQGTEQVIEQVAEESTGGQVDIDAGGGAALPDWWPDIPTPQGDIMMSAKSTDGMTATFVTTQSEADAVLAKLLDAGYTEEANMETGDLRIVSLVGSEWTVGLTIAPDAEDPAKVTMMYVVSPAAGG